MERYYSLLREVLRIPPLPDLDNISAGSSLEKQWSPHLEIIRFTLSPAFSAEKAVTFFMGAPGEVRVRIVESRESIWYASQESESFDPAKFPVEEIDVSIKDADVLNGLQALRSQLSAYNESNPLGLDGITYSIENFRPSTFHRKLRMWSPAKDSRGAAIARLAFLCYWYAKLQSGSKEDPSGWLMYLREETSAAPKDLDEVRTALRAACKR